MADAADGGVAWESSPSARVADRQSGRGLRTGFCLCILVVVYTRNEPAKFQQILSAVVQKFLHIQYAAKYELYSSLFVPYFSNDFLTAFHRL